MESRGPSRIAGHAKAAGINSAMEILGQLIGPVELSRLVESLPPEQADVIRRPPVATSWIPLAITVPLYDAILERAFGGNPARMIELGRLQFRDDLSTVYRFFIRVATPSFVAGRIGAMWQTYTRDCGTVTMVTSEPTWGELRFEGYPAPNPPIWYYVQGFIIGALEMTGVADVQVAIVQGGPGNTFCQYRISWK